MKDPANTILEVSMGYVVSRCLHAITELSVADALDDTAQTAEQLATRTGTNADALNRALRVLSSYGIFEACEDGYVHTPASRLVRADNPQSMRSFVRWVGSGLDWQTVERLDIRFGRASLPPT